MDLLHLENLKVNHDFEQNLLAVRNFTQMFGSNYFISGSLPENLEDYLTNFHVFQIKIVVFELQFVAQNRALVLLLLLEHYFQLSSLFLRDGAVPIPDIPLTKFLRSVCQRRDQSAIDGGPPIKNFFDFLPSRKGTISSNVIMAPFVTFFGLLFDNSFVLHVC